jgi:hypothetical protein
MPRRSLPLTESERLAEVVKRCYSTATLEMTVEELGGLILPELDIFQSLVAAGIAADFDSAVFLVAAYLDRGQMAARSANSTYIGSERRKKANRNS